MRRAEKVIALLKSLDLVCHPFFFRSVWRFDAARQSSPSSTTSSDCQEGGVAHWLIGAHGQITSAMQTLEQSKC